MNKAPALTTVWLPALAVALAVFAASHLLEPISRQPFNFGVEYAAMSRDPLAFVGMFPQRVLSPLLAWLLGLGGDRYWLFAHGTSVLLMTVIAAAVVLRGGGWFMAVTTTAALAGTGAVVVYKNHVGYPDEVTFLLLLGSVLAVRRPWLFWLLQAANVLNHEQILFFWPWLLLLCWREGGPRRPHLVGAVVVVLAYAGFRLWVGAVAPAQHLDTNYYREHHYFPVGTLGLSLLAVCALGIYFGLLPVVMFWHACVDGWRRVGSSLLLFGLCIVGIFTVAHDVYRFASFVFLPIVLAAARVGQLANGRGRLAWLLLAASTPVAVWLQIRPGSIFEHLVVHIFDCGCFDNMPRIVTCLVPRLWYVFVAYAAVLGVAAAVGCWLARRTRVV